MQPTDDIHMSVGRCKDIKKCFVSCDWNVNMQIVGIKEQISLSYLVKLKVCLKWCVETSKTLLRCCH